MNYNNKIDKFNYLNTGRLNIVFYKSVDKYWKIPINNSIKYSLYLISDLQIGFNKTYGIYLFIPSIRKIVNLQVNMRKNERQPSLLT